MRWLIGWCVLLGCVLAQFDPAKGWFTVRSEHFDIHYHGGLEQAAAEAMIHAEQAYSLLKTEYQVPPGRISIVLSDVGDDLNGFANPTNNVVGIYTAQFRSSELFNPRLESWWQTVIFHEVAHMFDLTQTRGPLAERTRIFGQLPAQSGVKPYPFVEGTVVYLKYKKLRESRLNDSRTRMAIRQMVLSGQFPTLDEIRQNYSKNSWPFVGFLAYNYGAFLVRYLEVRFGADALKRFTDANASLVATKDFNQPFIMAFGVSLDQIYADFVRWLPGQFAEEITGIRLKGLTQTTQISRLGWFSEGPSVVSGGTLYAHQSPLRSGIRLIEASGEREVARGSSPQASPDGRSFVFTALSQIDAYNTVSDLYEQNLQTAQVKRITRGERVYFARYAPDGKSIFMAKNTPDGSTELLRYFIDVQKTQPLRRWPGQDGVIHSFAVAPDGLSLVVSLLRRGGFQDLYRYTLETGALVALTQDKNVDSDPVFSPDGKYVLYSSDPDRVYNLYAIRIEDGAAFQVSNLLTGAFSPEFSADKQKLVFTGYDISGYNIYQMPYRPADWQPVRLTREVLPPYKPAEPAKHTSYDPFNYLKPLYWLPTASSSIGSEFGIAAGITFGASDPIGIHAYSVSAGFDSSLRGAFYDAGYSFSGLGFPLYIQAVGAGSQGIQAVSGVWDNPDGEIGLRYLRSDLLETPLNPVAQTVSHRISASLNGANGSGSDLFRSSSSLSLAGTALIRENTLDWRYSLRGVLGVQIRLPLEASHVLRFRVGGGFTTSPLAYDRLDLGLNPLVLGNLPPLVVRGYSPGQLRGAQIAMGSFEYRLPAWHIERGLGNWPLFFDDLTLGLFADAGTAGSPLDWKGTRFSIGAELRLGLTLAYLAPGSSLAIGLAQGIGEPYPGVYFLFNLPTILGGGGHACKRLDLQDNMFESCK
jgi:hypothetical protein